MADGMASRGSTPRDTLFARETGPQSGVSGSFVFDEGVTRVFPDMIQRSVPGYQDILDMTGILARRYVPAGGICWDLGCSLGAATLAIRRNLCVDGCRIMAVDNSAPMVEGCRSILEQDSSPTPVHLEVADIRQVEIQHAAMVVCNFTLQFLPPSQRPGVLEAVYRGLAPGGILLLSEKVIDTDPATEAALSLWHQDFKRSMGYSDLEIARKREALENVLVPESRQTHIHRLVQLGFDPVVEWFHHLAFASWVAIKPGSDGLEVARPESQTPGDES